MSIQGLNVSIEELRLLEVDQIVNTCNTLICSELESAFKNIKNSNSATLISAACSMRLRPENSQSPFVPNFVLQEQRGVIESDFSKESLQAIAQFSYEIMVPELKARLADIAWVTKSGSIKHAYLAIDAYIESAKQLLITQATWVDVIERVERALRLSCIFRGNSQRPDLFAKISDFIISEVDSKRLIDPPFYTSHLLKLACECGVGEKAWILSAAEEIAQNSFTKGDYRTSINAWQIALYSVNSQQEKEKQWEIWKKISNCHIKESERQDGSIIAASCLLKAIDALAKVPNTRKDRLELYEVMRDYQVDSLHELSEFSSPPQDISEIVSHAIAQVQGRDFFDMLFRLGVLVSQPTNMKQLKEDAVKEMQNSFAWIFGGTHIDHDGMTVATVPAGIGIEDGENGVNIWSVMMRNIRVDHQLAVRGQILPAIDEIMTQYTTSDRALSTLFKDHPFIPPEHEYYFIKGITFGLQGDFLSASHILIPQIENSLRYIARINGEEPTRLHGDGSQERSSLKVLLEHEVIIKAFGVDIVGNMQALLIDKIYGDLRNQMSHGYVPAHHFLSDAPKYMWWLVLHFLMVPFGSHWKEHYQSKT